MVTGARPKPDPGGSVGNPATGSEPRVAAELHRRLRARGSGIGEFMADAGSPDGCDAHPPQFHKIVDGADQLKLTLHPGQAAQRKSAKASPLDLPDDRLDGDLALGVDRMTSFRTQAPAHPLGRTEPCRNAPPRRAGRRCSVAITLDGDVRLDRPPVVLLQGLDVGLRA